MAELTIQNIKYSPMVKWDASPRIKKVRVIGVKIKAGKIRTMVECDIFLIYDVNI